MLYLQKPDGFQTATHVVGVFVECDGKILLLKRAPTRPQAGTWGMPAGKQEPREELISAAVRELCEETGIRVSAEALAGLWVVYVQYPKADFVFHMYRVRLSLDAIRDIVLNPAEHVDHLWVTPTQALSLPLIPDEDACIKLVYGV